MIRSNKRDDRHNEACERYRNGNPFAESEEKSSSIFLSLVLKVVKPRSKNTDTYSAVSVFSQLNQILLFQSVSVCKIGFWRIERNFDQLRNVTAGFFDQSLQ